MRESNPVAEPLIRSRRDVETYIGHFNARRYPEQIAYYAPDVRFSVGSLTLASPQAIADFYADFHADVDEHVELLRFAMTGDTVAGILAARFEPRTTYDRNGLRFETGTVYELVTFLFYTLQQGKIRRIHMARYAGGAEDFRSD
jgi:hypothetical protein